MLKHLWECWCAFASAVTVMGVTFLVLVDSIGVYPAFGVSAVVGLMSLVALLTLEDPKEEPKIQAGAVYLSRVQVAELKKVLNEAYHAIAGEFPPDTMEREAGDACRALSEKLGESCAETA